MGKGKKQRMQDKKLKAKLENEEDEEIKHIDSDEQSNSDGESAETEITPQRQAFLDYGFDKLEKYELMKIIRETEDMDEIIALTGCKDEQVRLKACQEMCPCHVKADRAEFWDAIFRLGKL